MKYRLVFNYVFLSLFLISKSYCNDFTHENTNEILGLETKPIGTIITVGTETNCHYNTIQDAIDAAADTDEIRISNNSIYFENLMVNKFGNISLRGGFANCLAAERNQQSNQLTIIDGNTSDSVINIQNTFTIDTRLTLDHLKIQNGESSNGGGGIHISGRQSSIAVYLNESVISNNTSRADTSGGGGLYCDHDNAFIAVFNTKIINNQAIQLTNITGVYGGGLYLSNECSLLMLSPSFIKNNISSGSGGGIAILSGATADLFGHQFCINTSCYGDNKVALEISGNRAGLDIGQNGGGIYIDGFSHNYDSELTISGIKLTNNNAGRGAGLYASNNAQVEIYRALPQCWDPLKCNLIANNKTSSGSDTGGGLYNLDAIVNIKSTVFEDNRAETATAIHSRGNLAKTTINSSLFTHNGNKGNDGWDDFYVIHSRGADTIISNSTIADNHAERTVLAVQDNGTLRVFSSIISDADTGDVVSSIGSNQTFYFCNIAHETTTIGGLGAENRVYDPQFIDAINRDYHLKLSSPAIDYCNGTNNNLSYDIDGEPRGIDDPRVQDNFQDSFYDIGMDEFIDEFTFLIYRDSFE